MLKNRILSIVIIFATLLMPGMAGALEMQEVMLMAAKSVDLTAKSYVVVDKQTGQILLSKDADLRWTPASLTKLVTALVVLDTKPQLSKSFAMSAKDEVGGARIATKPGVKYTIGDLFYASLIASANNATNALARSTGLPAEEFVKRMNQKAKDLGALKTSFLEPTGISEYNTTTAADYAKITQAAFANSYIHKLATTPTYSFRSTNNKRYIHNLKNTDKLLGDEEFTVIGGKTGYLDESQYNFTTEVLDRFGNNFIITLFGSQSSTSQFRETKQLGTLAGLSKAFAFVPQISPVAGASAGLFFNNLIN